MRTGIITGIVALLLSTAVCGQSEYDRGDPLFPAITSWYDIGLDQAGIDLMSSLEQPKNQPYQFAIPSPVSLRPGSSGFIVRSPEETVWVMPVASKGALSLNVILTPFNLPEGAYLFIYDSQHRIVRGAYTNESGNNSMILPLLPVPGDKMVVECHFPGKLIPDGAIGISQIAHDFAGFFRLADEKDEFFGQSGSCEIDINCSTDQSVLTTARSVCRLLILGSELCTGILVNNTGKEYKAYLLTAQHCIQDSWDASNTIFLFNYASPWCDGPDQNVMHSVAGSVIRATYKEMDFTLLELSSFPSLVFRPYFSGWNITSATPSATYVIHHPEGDVMKISRDNNPPSISSFPVTGYLANAFWKITRWDLGTTEDGSSGSPLFDQDNRLVGTLTGGTASCLSPTSDYFARLNLMFSASKYSGQNLTNWLDPSGTGATLVSGRDPYAYNLLFADTLTNLPENDPGQSDQYSSPGYGYSTGTNSDSLIMYAEYIPFSGTGELTWAHLEIAETSFLTSADSVEVFVLSGGSTPGTVLASRVIKLEAVTDNYDLEVDFGRTITVTGPFYVAYRVYYEDTIGSSQPQFTVKHSQPYVSESLNTAWFHDGSGWKSFAMHPSFPMYTSLAINAVMVDNSILNSVEDIKFQNQVLSVFPNPFKSSVSFSVNSEVVLTDLNIYDNSGNIVFSGEYRNSFPGTLTVDLPLLMPGVYHFSLALDSEVHAGTIIKINSQ